LQLMASTSITIKSGLMGHRILARLGDCQEGREPVTDRCLGCVDAGSLPGDDDEES
jgi:hypothetical protein